MTRQGYLPLVRKMCWLCTMPKCQGYLEPWQDRSGPCLHGAQRFAKTIIMGQFVSLHSEEINSCLSQVVRLRGKRGKTQNITVDTCAFSTSLFTFLLLKGGFLCPISDRTQVQVNISNAALSSDTLSPCWLPAYLSCFVILLQSLYSQWTSENIQHVADVNEERIFRTDNL